MSNQQSEGTPNPSDPQPGFPPPAAYHPSEPAGPSAPSGQPYGQPTQPYGQPTQPYGQPYPQPAEPYGQPPQSYPYGQQATTHSAQQQAYGQPVPPPAAPQPGESPYTVPNYPAQYGTQQPYPQAGYPGQVYPAQGYPAGGWTGTDAPAAAKSPVLGIIGLVVVAIALLMCLPTIGPVVDFYSSVIIASGTTQVDPSTVSEAMVEGVAGPLMTLIFGGPLLGLVGFVIGIIAIPTRRGRLWGILAVVLGILAPIILFTMLGIGIAPVVEAVR